MDYSLLVGIHDLKRGNKEKVRDHTLSVFNPNKAAVPGAHDTATGGAFSSSDTLPQTADPKGKLRPQQSMTAHNLKRMISNTSPTPFEQDMDDEFEADSDNRDHKFYHEHGGLQATDIYNRPVNELYYLGVIDLLTRYSWRKRAENFWKGLHHSRSQISAVPPADYAKRFLKFIEQSLLARGEEPPDSKSESKALQKSKERAEKELRRSSLTEGERVDKTISTNASTAGGAKVIVPRVENEAESSSQQPKARKSEEKIDLLQALDKDSFGL